MNITNFRKRLLLAGAVTGSLLAGAAAGATLLAPTIASAAGPTPSAAASPMPGHGTPAHENAETAVTGANALKAQAAAVKAVGGGTAGAVTTDFNKSGYEVTVTKSDGTKTEVHLDSSFNVMQGGPGRPNDNDSDDSASASSSSTGA